MSSLKNSLNLENRNSIEANIKKIIKQDGLNKQELLTNQLIISEEDSSVIDIDIIVET